MCLGGKTRSRNTMNKNRSVVEVKSAMCTYNEEEKKNIGYIINSSYHLSVILGRKFTFSYIYVFFKVYVLLLRSG